jgi:hypothetical protein
VGLEHAQPCTPALCKVLPPSTDCTHAPPLPLAEPPEMSLNLVHPRPTSHVPRPTSHVPHPGAQFCEPTAAASRPAVFAPVGRSASSFGSFLFLRPPLLLPPNCTTAARVPVTPLPLALQLHTLLNSFSALYFSHTPTRTHPHTHTPAPIPLPPPLPTTTTTNTQITPFGLDRTPTPTPDAFQRPRIITTNLPPQYMEFALAPPTQAA